MRFKDINECLQAGVTSVAIMACVEQEIVIKPEVLKSAGDFKAEIFGKFYPSGNKEDQGLPFLWGDEFPLRVRYQEVTVHTGFPSHGKSQALGHLIVHLAAKGERACIASFEMQAAQTYYRAIRQACARKRPFGKEETEKFDRIIAWMNERIWVYHHQGAAALDDVLSVWRYARRRYGVRQFVLDSLMMTTMASGDEQYGEQNDTMQKLCDFADVENVHVHLVAHSKKLKDEKVYPRSSDISGSQAIANKAFNVCIWWRNKEKELKVGPLFEKHEKHTRAGEACKKIESEEERRALLAKYPALSNEEWAKMNEWATEKDAYFICDKQRNGEGVLAVKELWFDREALQFLADPDGKPVNYLGELDQVRLELTAEDLNF